MSVRSLQRMSLSSENEEDFLPNGDGGEEVLSPKEVLGRIEEGWLNEKIAPELLPPLEQEKEAMMRQIKLMEKNVRGLDKRDMRTEIHKLELERIKFVVVSYMRVRLFKVQQLAFHYHELEMKRPSHEPSVIMAEELAFIKRFVGRTEEYLQAVLISKLPLPLQKLDRKKFKMSPHMDAHVFFRVKEESTIEVEDSHEQIHNVTLHVGEQHFMRYQPMAKLLWGSAVHLV